MKRWIPLLSVVLLLSAAPAFADHCAYCFDESTCAFGATIGAVDCRIHFNPTWCQELGFCNDWGAAPRSFNADWKVVKVSVLTPGPDTPARTGATAVAAVVKSDALLSQR